MSAGGRKYPTRVTKPAPRATWRQKWCRHTITRVTGGSISGHLREYACMKCGWRWTVEVDKCN